MSTDSDGSYSEMEMDDNGEWKKVRLKRKSKSKAINDPKRHKGFTTTEINNIIMGTNTCTTSQTKTPETNLKTTEINTGSQKESSNKKQSTRNYSPRMREIQHKIFKHLFHLTTDTGCTRISFCDFWERLFPDADDEIIQTKTGLLLKTNQDRVPLMGTLKRLVNINKIINFKETAPNSKPPSSFHSPTFSVVIASVELEISDEVVSQHLTKLNLEHRFCKRITSQKTKQPTTLIRIISGSQNTSETLLK